MPPDQAASWLVIVGVLLASLSLRGPIVAPTPVLRDIEHDLSIGASSAGLITTAPVLMFALLTPIAALVIRRVGAELALLISLSAVLAGTFIRALPGFGTMIAGMIVIGAGVAVGNIVIPVIIRRDVPPARVPTMTAAYSAMLNAGSLVTSLLTAPLASVVGWVWALLIWSAFTIAGIALWSIHARRERISGHHWGDRFSGETAPVRTDATLSAPLETGPMPVISRNPSFPRRPITWLLMTAFAVQTTIYYALSTWLPTIAADELNLGQTDAGALASLFQGVAIVGAFVVPLLARFAPPIVPALVISTAFLTLTLGMLLAPQLLWIWLSIGAVGHAGGFVVIFSTLVAVAHSDAEAARYVRVHPGIRLRDRSARGSPDGRAPRGDQRVERALSGRCRPRRHLHDCADLQRNHGPAPSRLGPESRSPPPPAAISTHIETVSKSDEFQEGLRERIERAQGLLR